MIVMGIESSCDETGVGIVRWVGDGTLELLAEASGGAHWKVEFDVRDT